MKNLKYLVSDHRVIFMFFSKLVLLLITIGVIESIQKFTKINN